MAITKKDIGKLSEVFVTKQEFRDGLLSLKSELTDRILTSEDTVLKKVEDVLIEQRMAYAQSRRHEDKLEDHEKRIQVIEARV